MWYCGIARTLITIVDVLSDVHDAFVFGANFQSGRGNDLPNDTTHCADNRTVLKIKPEKLLSENDLQLLIVDATKQRIERPKNQVDHY